MIQVYDDEAADARLTLDYGTGQAVESRLSDGAVLVTRQMTPQEASWPAAAADLAARTGPGLAARAALADALALAPLYPAPSPDETAIIDAQVGAALTAFRNLADPPADVVALAAAVVSWRAEIA